MKVSIEAPESFQTLPTGTQAQLLKQTEYFLKQQVKATDKNEDSDWTLMRFYGLINPMVTIQVSEKPVQLNNIK